MNNVPSPYQSWHPGSPRILSSYTTSPKPSRIPRHISQVSSTGDESQVKKAKKEYYNKDGETYEAEGQLSTPQSESNMQTGAQKLEEIWKKLGFSENSSIDIKQFAKFSQYVDIGDDEKLQHLFDKLDTDHDGRLTINDFIDGHQRSSALKRPSTGVTPSPLLSPQHTPYDGQRKTPRTMAMSKKLFPSPNAERNTSVLSNSRLSGIFSCIDPNETGYANADDVVDLWETLNIPDPPTLLQDLGINPHSKVNLEELTGLIDQAVSDSDVDIFCQIALVMCENEIQYRRTLFNKVRQERDKYLLDLREVNARNAILAKEFDDRHIEIEKSTEAKLFEIICEIKKTYFTIEHKHQEQIAKLQNQLDKVNEEHANESEHFEMTISQVKEEELKLKEQALQFQKEVQKLEAEVADLSDKLSRAENEKINLLKDLEEMEELQKKLPEYDHEELENSMKIMQEKLDRLQEENKNLKDRNDELIGELEVTKQQSMMRKQRRSLPTVSSSMIPVRDGTSLSEYFMKRRASATSVSSNDVFEADETEDNFLNRHKAKHRLQDTQSHSYDDDSESETQSLSNSMKISLLEKDEKEREHWFRVELSLLEEQHCREKQELHQMFEIEKAQLRENLEHKKQQALAEKEKELQTAFALEKQDLLERSETEKNLILQELARLKEQRTNHTEARIQQVESELTQKIRELEAELDNRQTIIENFEKSLADLKLHFRLQEEELKQECDRQLDEKEEQMKVKIRELESQHVLQIMDYEDMLNGGFDSLRGKLRDDFLTLLQEKTESVIAIHQTNMCKEMEALQIKLENEYSAKHMALQKQQEDLEMERMVMLKQLKNDRDCLDAQRVTMVKQQHVDNHLEMERAAMLEREKEESWNKERLVVEQNHRDEIVKLKEELGDAFEKERTALMQRYEDQIIELRKHLGDLRVCVDAERTRHNEQLEKQQELTEQINKSTMEELQGSFDSEKKQLEHKIETLQQEVSQLKYVIEEKDQIIAALKEKLLEIDFQKQQLEMQIEECNSDQLLLSENEQLVSEKNQLQKSNTVMQEEIDQLKVEKSEFSQCKMDMQGEVDKLISEKERLKESQIELENQIEKLVSEKDDLEQNKAEMKNEINKLASEKDDLEECKTQMENQIEKLNSEKEHLEQCKEQMENQIEKLISEKESLDQYKTQTENKIEQLISDNESLGYCKTEMKNQIEKLITEKEVLEQCKADMQREMDKLHSEKKAFHESRSKFLSEMENLEPEQTQTSSLEWQSLKADNERLKCRLQHTLQQMEELSRNMEQENDILRTQLQENQLELSKLKEKNSEIQHKSESVQSQINESSIQKLSKEKEKRSSAPEKTKSLKRLLQETTDKLLTLITELSSSQSKHMKEIETWKEKTKDLFQLENFTKHQMGLVEQQQQLMHLQTILMENSQVMNRVLREFEQHYQKKIVVLETEQNHMKLELQTVRNELTDKCEKIKNLFEMNERKTLHIKRLMVDNDDLVKRVLAAEQAQKEAARKYINISKTNATLKKTLTQVYQSLT